MKVRTLYFYPGRTTTYDYKAVPLSSSIVVGNPGSGKTRFLNNLIIRLIMETNPRELSIRLLSYKSDFGPWDKSVSGDKIIPQIEGCISVDGEDNPYEIIALIYEAVKQRQEFFNSKGYTSYIDYVNKVDDAEKRLLYIVRDFSKILDKCPNQDIMNNTINVLKNIVSIGDRYGVSIMLISDNVDYIPNDVIQKFPVKICSNIDDNTMELIMDDYELPESLSEYGDIWCKYLKDEPIHLYVPFYPDIWISKFMKYYSVKVAQKPEQ